MRDQKEHPYVPKLKQNFAERKIDRREFLRTSTLLGVSALAAYEFAGRIEGRSLLPKAGAADLPKGGNLQPGLARSRARQSRTPSPGAAPSSHAPPPSTSPAPAPTTSPVPGSWIAGRRATT